ncbi:hypothetical protein [Parahaliea mediterranea]|uniref:Uncharacterized protein n=1 Tax=Parahaliea mediterranea TaxID=651086 RepID=A0A939DD26_9GAMM|nr:hypothetical protein [Parahaliea mediterranea]MBN7795921.1 hypothetical protein [Parahaliea mediterranea]
MKRLATVALAIGLSQVIATGVNAAERSELTDRHVVSSAFGPGASISSEDFLSDMELQQTHGKVAPLVMVATIAGLDIALMSFFYGVYVPNYASSGGGCLTCSDKNTDLQ